MSQAAAEPSARSAATAAELRAWVEESRTWFERELELCLAADAESESVPSQLRAAMRYAVTGGGKRLRPMLVRLACQAFGGSDADAVRPAIAVELIHAYSLVHDDLPCMDDDDWRRGRPSSHKQFGEALALLAADALQAKAFEVLAIEGTARAAQWGAVLARAVGDAGMVGGQVLDMTLTDDAPRAATIERMHAMKTGALITASAELGAIAAGATQRQRDGVRNFAAAVGACFQATDDILDVTADRASLGKTPGKDARLHKATLVAALGLERARERAAQHAEAARVAALELGGRSQRLALALVAEILDRRA
jgi:geranylgeranyl pyrophosphate synthase